MIDFPLRGAAARVHAVSAGSGRWHRLRHADGRGVIARSAIGLGGGRAGREIAGAGSIELKHGSPLPEQYRALCGAVGWRVPPVGETLRALAGSQDVVCARSRSGELVGLGRLVGDGVLHWCIVDVMVDPRFQRHGVGTRIIGALEGVVASSGIGAVALVAAPDVIPFYERIGYRRSGNSWMVRRTS
jgi:GNAT superfamily N-acetyltransferase